MRNGALKVKVAKAAGRQRRGKGFKPINKGVKMFGRRKKPDEPAHPTTGRKVLSMLEVYTLAFAAAQQRGFPDASPDAVADRVVWLERRGLPGILALTRDFVTYKDVPAIERGISCPIIAGTLMMNEFEKLVSKEPGHPRLVKGATNGALILPKVAQYAERISHPVCVTWVTVEPFKILGETVVDGARIAHRGEPRAMLENTGVGLSLHGEALDVATQTISETTNVPMDIFEAFISFIGRERIMQPIKVHSLIEDDRETLDLLRMMSAGDRSVLEAASHRSQGDEVVMTTSPDSNNEKIWSRFIKYGWTAPHKFEDAPAEIRNLLSQYKLTAEGREAVPMLLFALHRFESVKY